MPETTVTANQGWPLPDLEGGFLHATPDYMHALAIAIEKQAVMKFTDQADMTNSVDEADGMVYFLTAGTQPQTLWLWANGGPQRLWPPVPKISSGVGAPSGSGENGELYFELDA